MLIERTCYFPKPGKLQDVLLTRHQACDVRISLGLAPGNVFVEKTDKGPIVHWSCRFSSEIEHRRDSDLRDKSRDFSEVRTRMGRLIDKFDRHVLTSAPRPDSVLQEFCLNEQPIVPVEHTFDSDGLALKGYLYQPLANGPFPCLIFNHGSSINQGSEDVCRPGIAHLFLSWGLAVFMPHRRGYGNSPGTPWQKEVGAEYGSPEYAMRLTPRLQAETDDVVAAYNYVKTLPAVMSDRIGVMGSSFGGIMTLLSAAREPAFRCAVEFAGAAMNWDIVPDLRAYLLSAAEKITRPIYFAQAKNDYCIRPTPELAEAAGKSNGSVYHKIYPDFGITRMEGHLLCGSGIPVWENDIRWFLEKYL